MKIILSFFLLISAGFFFACDKDKLASNSNNTITGKWKLTETLNDPGDGSGKWTKVTSDHSSYLLFKADGAVESSANELYNVKAYKLIDSVRVEFIQQDNSKYVYRYTIDNSKLEMNPPCIEPCGLRYVKVEN